VTVVWLVLACWAVLSVATALVIGRFIRAGGDR